jgi:hypothetical protein
MSHDALDRRSFLKNAGLTALASAVGTGSAAAAAAPHGSAASAYDFDTIYSRIGTDCVKWDRQIRNHGKDAIAVGMARFAKAGVGVESCLFGLDGSDDIEAVVTEALDSRPWEVVVIGGGVRKPEDQLDLFERIINLVHRHAPDSAIAFNSTPADTFDAAARWLDPLG